jgi:hypothetical protein
MPTPPKESIRGTKAHQITSFEFAQKQFSYIREMEVFAESEDFTELSETEKAFITNEIEQQNYAYETLRQRVEDY